MTVDLLTAYVILMQWGPVAWKSHKQQSVALSSTEAEYVGQTVAATTLCGLET